jgi:hypothetical protein
MQIKRVLSSGIQHCNLVKLTDVLEEHLASIFSVKEQAKQETSMVQSSACCLLYAGFLLGLLLDPENGGDMFSKMLDEFHQIALRYYPEDGTVYICIIQPNFWWHCFYHSTQNFYIFNFQRSK